ncbi:LysR family transcriptional regulator [Moritella yayanosii]|uniref:LysR family transcriptional regulator n=1 Tax=Moritella yayanosii TaxID=69539 RepID=A0A330LNY9_9GAMM|nr:LysR family transcriptional regulator [Moritella yayanosii]SQD78717.1 LysR family transcriptional regulator [Moritella yayanosii]
MLNPLWLNTFVTLIDTGHFTKTAEKLFMTQPGVSQHIRKLEQACDHALIRRENKRFEITEQGRLVYQYAGQLAKNEHELLENLTFDDPFTGNCTIACSGSLALILYPQLLELQNQHRKLIIQLTAAPNHQILNEIQQGIIDLGIVTHVSNHNLFDVQALGREQLCLVLPANIETYNYSAKLLIELGLISHPDAEHYLSLYFAKNQRTDFNDLNISEIPVSGYVNQISQILQPVAKGLGFTVLPKSAVDSFHEPQNLQIFNPKKPVMESLYVVKKRNRALPARLDTVNSILQEHFDMEL